MFGISGFTYTSVSTVLLNRHGVGSDSGFCAACSHDRAVMVVLSVGLALVLGCGPNYRVLIKVRQTQAYTLSSLIPPAPEGCTHRMRSLTLFYTCVLGMVLYVMFPQQTTQSFHYFL